MRHCRGGRGRKSRYPSPKSHPTQVKVLFRTLPSPLPPHQHGRPVTARHDTRRRREEQSEKREERRRESRIRILLVVGPKVVEARAVLRAQVSGERTEAEEHEPKDDARDGDKRDDQEHRRRRVDKPARSRSAEKVGLGSEAPTKEKQQTVQKIRQNVK